MTFTSLASSSDGNCYVVEDGESRILLECGISFKRLKKGLEFRVGDVKGCLISHEHGDHAGCYMDLIRSGVEVFASQGTAEALGCELITPIEAGERFRVGSFIVLPFETWHGDAAEPLGFFIGSRADGEKLVFATDTVNLALRFQGVSLLALEANFDAESLARCQRMPEKVKRRVVHTHMEIDTLCRYLKTLDLSGCREVFLLHLSRRASREREFVERVRAVVPEGVRVTACPEQGAGG